MLLLDLLKTTFMLLRYFFNPQLHIFLYIDKYLNKETITKKDALNFNRLMKVRLSSI